MADFDFMLFIIKVNDVEKGLMFNLVNFKTIWVITKANWMKHYGFLLLQKQVEAPFLFYVLVRRIWKRDCVVQVLLLLQIYCEMAWSVVQKYNGLYICVVGLHWVYRGVVYWICVRWILIARSRTIEKLNLSWNETTLLARQRLLLSCYAKIRGGPDSRNDLYIVV